MASVLDARVSGAIYSRFGKNENLNTFLLFPYEFYTIPGMFFSIWYALHTRSPGTFCHTCWRSHSRDSSRCGFHASAPCATRT